MDDNKLSEQERSSFRVGGKTNVERVEGRRGTKYCVIDCVYTDGYCTLKCFVHSYIDTQLLLT